MKKMALKIDNGKRLSIFSCGADMKARASYYQDGIIHFTVGVGDLYDMENYLMFMREVASMKAGLNLKPDMVAYDLHPGYMSSNAGRLFAGVKSIGVQHHHAHIAAVMAAADMDDPVIGISFDGTGYGTDGNMWGGEFLTVSKCDWARCGHLGYMSMPGGEAAVREPWRMAFSLVYGSIGDRIFDKNLLLLKVRAPQELVVMQRSIDKNINAPLTSSAGRLFDAVSSILGIIHNVSFEAEAAIALEKKAALSSDAGVYPYEISSCHNMYTADYRALVNAIVKDMEAGVRTEHIARRFHNSLADLSVRMAKLIRRDTGINSVVLSGGVFQNNILNLSMRDLLEKEDFMIVSAANIPVNDLGICIGQTYVALNSVEEAPVCGGEIAAAQGNM